MYFTWGLLIPASASDHPCLPTKKYIKLHLCFGLALISKLVQQHSASVKYAELNQYKHTYRKFLH